MLFDSIVHSYRQASRHAQIAINSLLLLPVTPLAQLLLYLLGYGFESDLYTYTAYVGNGVACTVFIVIQIWAGFRESKRKEVKTC